MIWDKGISGVPQGGRNIKINLYWSISTCLWTIRRGDERANCMSSCVSNTKTPKCIMILTPACVHIFGNFSSFKKKNSNFPILNKKPFFLSLIRQLLEIFIAYCYRKPSGQHFRVPDISYFLMASFGFLTGVYYILYFTFYMYYGSITVHVLFS